MKGSLSAPVSPPRPHPTPCPSVCRSLPPSPAHRVSLYIYIHEVWVHHLKVTAKLIRLLWYQLAHTWPLSFTEEPRCFSLVSNHWTAACLRMQTDFHPGHAFQNQAPNLKHLQNTSQGTNGLCLKAIRDQRLQGSVVPRRPNSGDMAICSRNKGIPEEESSEVQEGRSFNWDNTESNL